MLNIRDLLPNQRNILNHSFIVRGSGKLTYRKKLIIGLNTYKRGVTNEIIRRIEK